MPLSRIRLFGARAAAAASLAMAVATASAQTNVPTQDQLLQRVEALSQELERVKSQLQQMKEAQAKEAQVRPAAPAPAAPTPAAAPEPAGGGLSGGSSTVISSYGEINYNRPKDHSQAQADLRRFVFGLQQRFDERTKFVAEVEIEHAIASADDSGEVEVEQLYVERRLNPTYGVRAGLVLMPIGLLNTNHEPTVYYGVERNFVETAIVPTTWREGAVQVFGEHDNGISWSAGIGTGFDLTKWDATSSEGAESPLGAIHQELQLAKAHDLSLFGNVDWRGMPGVRVGAGLFTGKASQGTAGFAAPDARVTVWDLHANWTPGPWDLSALVARGTISNAGALNLTFAGSAFPVPRSFDGWYAQAAYRWRLPGDMTLAPFARYERFNTGRGFDGLPPALNPGDLGTEGVGTVGVNFYLNPAVVLKADLQRFKRNKDANRLDLGLGYSF